MEGTPDEKDTVTSEELLMSNTIQVDALAQLLIEKGIISREEFFGKLKEVQGQYRRARLEPAETSISTLGSPGKRTQFRYTGNVQTGVTLAFKVKAHVSKEFFQAILRTFDGLTIPGGFSMTHPTPGGLGDWVGRNSRQLNSEPLTPRHASFIAAILVHEGYVLSSLVGNAVFLNFRKNDRSIRG